MKKPKKKGEKKLFVTVFKIISVIVIFLIQAFIMWAFYSTAKSVYNYARIFFEIIKIATVIYILYRHDNSMYKLSWILFIMVFPIVGLMAYVLWGNSKIRKKRKEEFQKVQKETEKLLQCDYNLIQKLDFEKQKLVNYSYNISGYPVYENERAEYFEIGEKFFDSLKKDLMNAKKYILLEFYIFSKGKLWDEIFEILKAKSKEGVKVEIIYDSLGCIFRLPKNYKEELTKAGIKLYKFNPFTVFINGYINYRDHRKIVVIDGNIAYTGGVNLADEYANIIERFGHWKDGGVKFNGNACWSFALMFLRQRRQIADENIDYLWYKNNDNSSNVKKGYVLPFSDGPENRKNPTENIYIQTINMAKEYVYITTPYFIPNETLLNAILNAARSGIDVRVVTPHIPDKKPVQMVTRSSYDVLMEAGVKVYEYKPGFIHTKSLVSDDEVAIIGSANLDFRSMHLNFECNAWMYKTGEEIAIKEDFLDMIQNKCVEYDINKWYKRSIKEKVLEALYSAFSPML